MPEIGRFISEDPWKGTILTPTTMNPYPYVLNNPIRYVDLLGLNPQPSWAGYPNVTNGVIDPENQVGMVSVGVDMFNMYGPSITDKVNNFWYQAAPAIEKGIAVGVEKIVYIYEGIKSSVSKTSNDKASSSRDTKSKGNQKLKIQQKRV